jgi:hypothetical protein
VKSVDSKQQRAPGQSTWTAQASALGQPPEICPEPQILPWQYTGTQQLDLQQLGFAVPTGATAGAGTGWHTAAHGHTATGATAPTGATASETVTAAHGSVWRMEGSEEQVEREGGVQCGAC